MRSLWTGSIAFGLVNIPVKLFTAVREHTAHFHLMSPDGQCRLRQKLYCPETGKEYDFSQTAKAYELAKDEYVLIDKKELAKLQPEKGHTIDIVDFTKEAEVDPIYFDKTYYLGPDKRAGKPYRLLLEVMLETDMVAIGRFVMRTKEYLCVIRPAGDVLCLDTLYFADEVLGQDAIPELKTELKGVRITPTEKKMGVKLVESMVTKFDPSQYRDEYEEAVEKLVRAKSKGKKVSLAATEPKRTKVVDLMDALQKSIAAGKARKPAGQRKAS